MDWRRGSVEAESRQRPLRTVCQWEVECFLRMCFISVMKWASSPSRSSQATEEAPSLPFPPLLQCPSSTPSPFSTLFFSLWLLFFVLCFLPPLFSPSFQKEDQGINKGNKRKVWDPKELQAGALTGHRDLMVECWKKESRGPVCANTSGRELGVS